MKRPRPSPRQRPRPHIPPVVRYDSSQIGAELILPSGRRLDAMVGISEQMSIGTGYDDFIGNGPGAMERKDRIALADYMIGVWQRFKELP